MQVIVIRYSERTPYDTDKAFQFAKNLHKSKHGSIVVVPDDIEYSLIEIEGDELPVILGIDDKTFKIVA